MAELCLSFRVLWKVELVRDIIGYLAEEIFFPPIYNYKLFIPGIFHLTLSNQQLTSGN